MTDSIRLKMQRFYPESIPSFEHEPTRDRFRIKQFRNGEGQGVVSLTSFESGDVVFALTGTVSAEVTQFSLQVGKNQHLHDPYFYGKILHSCDPNCHVDVENRRFIATKPIRKGDLVTMDYAQTEDYLFKSFPCCCGAANCRGVVLGRKQFSPDMTAPARAARRS